MRALIIAALPALAATPAAATISLTYSDVGLNIPATSSTPATSVDARYELAGGYLATTRNLPLVGAANATTALPPLERAVGEVRIGGSGQRTRGLHIPNSATGIPGVANTPVAPPGFVPAEGVFSALTNVAPIDRLAPAPAGQVTTAWGNGTPVAFSMVRTGTTVTFTVGTDVWQHSADYLAQINAIQFRLATPNTSIATPGSSMAITGLSHTSGSGTQLIGDLLATNGEKRIALYEGVSGDFSLTGNFAMAWTGTRPNGSNIAAQIKLLEIDPLPPSIVPEPGTWAMLITGFGLVGAARRRRRNMTATI